MNAVRVLKRARQTGFLLLLYSFMRRTRPARLAQIVDCWVRERLAAGLVAVWVEEDSSEGDHNHGSRRIDCTLIASRMST